MRSYLCRQLVKCYIPTDDGCCYKHVAVYDDSTVCLTRAIKLTFCHLSPYVFAAKKGIIHYTLHYLVNEMSFVCRNLLWKKASLFTAVGLYRRRRNIVVTMIITMMNAVVFSEKCSSVRRECDDSSQHSKLRGTVVWCADDRLCWNWKTLTDQFVIQLLWCVELELSGWWAWQAELLLVRVFTKIHSSSSV